MRANVHKQRLSGARLGDRLLGPLLKWLVRERVLPQEPPFDPARPLCYVLENDALSSQLILQKVCRAQGLPLPFEPLAAVPGERLRRVVSLARLRGWLVRRTDWRTHLEDLALLVRATEQSEEADIQLVPVSIFLGRARDKEAGWFKVLFSENWPVAGRFRRLISVLLHGRNTMVRFSRPISLREALTEDSGEARTARKVSRLLRVHFRLTRTAVIGPDLSHRRTLVDGILNSRRVREVIAAEAEKKNQPLRKLRKRARSYALEISADYSHPLIVVCARLLRWFWNRIYDGVRIHHLNHLLNVPKGAEIIYVPCHRSHIDYLLISYLVYDNGFPVPHIAAGVNLNMPVVGSIIRRGGGFFLRRSFANNALYSAVFHEYVDTIFARGVSMEYFIEGTRSRTGRSLRPQTGMLAMTVRSFLRHPQRPVVFLPVYFGYERMVEGNAYLSELSGGKKQKETLRGLFRSFSILKQKFGAVDVGFGRPLHLEEHLRSCCSDWAAERDAPRPAWLPGAVDELAEGVMRGINEAAAVNPINLVGLALLSSPRNAMAEEDLIAQIELLRTLLRELPYSPLTTVTEMPAADIVAYAERLGVVVRQRDQLGDLIVSPEDKAWRLSYFRNNTLHLVTLYSWCACVFRNNVTFAAEDLTRMARVVYPFLKDELFLVWDTGEFLAACQECLALFERLGLLVPSGQPGVLRRAQGETFQALQLRLLSRPIFSSLERFYITVALLVKNGSGRLSAVELENLCHLTARRLAVIYGFDAPEFFDKRLFKNFIRMLRRAGVLDTADDGKLVFDEALEIVIQDAKIVLSKEVRHSIWQLSPEPAGADRLEAA